MPAPDDNAPTPMPGAKPSGGGQGSDPRASQDKASAAEEAAANKKAPQLTDEEKDHLQTHVSALQKLVGKVSAPGGTSPGASKPSSVDQAVNEAVQSAPGNTSDY